MILRDNYSYKLDGQCPITGFGPFKKIWYSICSEHYIFDSSCPRCVVGGWRNVWKMKLNEWIEELCRE